MSKVTANPLSPRSIYWPYVLLAYLSMLILGSLDNARGPYYVDIATDLKLIDSKASFLFVTTSLVSFLIGRKVPQIIGKIHLLTAVRFGHLVMAAGFFCLSLTYNFHTLVAAAAFFGVGFGLINVTQNLLIIDGVLPQKRRQILSGLHSIYALASLLSPLAIAFFIKKGLDWRHGVMILSVLPLFGFIYSFFSTAQEHKSVHDQQTKPAYFFRSVLVFSIGVSFYTIAEVLLSSRLVLYLRRELEFSPEGASLYLAYFFIFLFASRVTFTLLPMPKISNRFVLIAGLLSSAATFLLGLVVSPLFLLLTGFFMGPLFAVAIDYATEVFSYAQGYAISYSMAIQSLVMVLMHYFIGLVTQHYGIQTALYCGPAFLLIAFFFILLKPWSLYEKA